MTRPLLILLALLSWPAAPLAHGADNGAETSIGLQNGLSFNLPSHWRSQAGAMGVLFYAQDDEKPALRMAVIELGDNASGQEEVSRLSQEQLDQLEQSYRALKPNVGVSQLTRFNLRGLLFLKFSCQYVKDGLARLNLLLCLYRGPQSFILSFDYPEARQEEFAPLVERIIASLKLSQP